MSSMIGSIVGGVLDMAGTAMQQKVEHEAALENSDFYRQSAVDEGVEALDREQVRRTQIREALGQQVVGVAKSGVSFTGSAILALNDSIQKGEQDMIALKRHGEHQVSDFLRAAKGELEVARNVRRVGGLKAGRSGFNTYSNLNRSKQPAQRTRYDSNDRINNPEKVGDMGGFGDSYGTSEGE